MNNNHGIEEPRNTSKERNETPEVEMRRELKKYAKEMGMPSYIFRKVDDSNRDFNYEDFVEDENEKGNANDDSDDEDMNFLDNISDVANNGIISRLHSSVDDENAVTDKNPNSFVKVKVENESNNENNTNQPIVKLPSIPKDWEELKPQFGQPENFKDVDNPGKWPSFTFRPEFEGKGNNKKYKAHSLPTGVIPVPEGTDGKRTDGGWEFFYDGWCKPQGGTIYRDGRAEDRHGKLNKDVLIRLGLTRKRLLEKDSLFFYQLLLPIGEPSKSDVENDPRKAFYTEVQRYSNLYGFQKGIMCSPYGHYLRPSEVEEHVRFDGVIVRDGVLGGSDGALYRRWDEGNSMHDEFISGAVNMTRFLQLKRIMKLCDNSGAKKRNEPGYNPAYKYDLIYDVLIHNVNALTETAELDLCGDETTWSHMGYGEAGSGLLGRIQGKPGVTKGGQLVILSDINRYRPRAYMHRHKLHKKPTGWTAMGPLEVKMMADKIATMVSTDEETKLFREKPCFTFDNYFSGDKIMEYLGENGFGAIMTCRRDRLPGDVKKTSLHHKRTGTDIRTKVARFHTPVVAVKRQDGYERVHVSFQSTSSCNISTVNVLNKVEKEIRTKTRGRGENKITWGIETNQARSHYLSTYCTIDNIDHLIQNANLFYRCWKYWHSPVLHAKALAIVVAYDMYKEIVEGHLDPSWRIVEKKIMSFWEFRDNLSKQLLSYNPRNKKYPGDKNFRKQTSLHKKGRPKKRKAGDDDIINNNNQRNNYGNQASLEAFHIARDSGRFIESMCDKRKHGKNTEKGRKSRLKCVVCDEWCYSKCHFCGVAMHADTVGNKTGTKACWDDYHDPMFFGLAYCDCNTKADRDAFIIAGPKKRSNHKKYMKQLLGHEV